MRKQTSDENKENKSIQGLPIPISPDYHHKNSMADNKENY